MAAEDCGRVALEAGLKKVKAYVKGPGNGRESAIRSLHNWVLKWLKLLISLQHRITVVVRQKNVAFNK